MGTVGDLLTIAGPCDTASCPATAQVAWVAPDGGSLQWCGHHDRENRAVLASQGWARVVRVEQDA
jgi:hypothetical protein